MKYLPYKESLLENIPLEPPEVNSFKFIKLDKNKDVDHLRSEIKSLLNDYEFVFESSSFDEIKLYAKRIEKISKEFGINWLTAKAEKILISSENFDLEEINQHIAELPEILKKMSDEIES